MFEPKLGLRPVLGILTLGILTILGAVAVVDALGDWERFGSTEHGGLPSQESNRSVQLGPRPYYLIEDMQPGALRSRLEKCAGGPFETSHFSIGHRGAPLQFPEHTKESYEAAARMGAGILECDVAFTKDRKLVCRHSQCDLHTTTNILAIPELAAKCTEPFSPADPNTTTPASAKCCTSDVILEEFKSLCGKMDGANPDATTVQDYLAGTADWRTDSYSTCGTLLSHAESIELIDGYGLDFMPELKTPNVEMPFEGDYTQRDYAQQLIDEYKTAGIAPTRVYAQSFLLNDVLYWIGAEPAFGKQAVFLDGRYRDPTFDHTDPDTWSPDMSNLVDSGVNVIAPPMWMLVADDGGEIVPSVYSKAAKDAGLDIVTWTLERSGPLAGGGGWYYQTTSDIIDKDGDTFEMLHALAMQVGIVGILSDWPATVTYYANCFGL